MSVGRKIFIGYSVLILLMGGLFLSSTYIIVNQLVQHLSSSTQKDTLEDVVRHVQTLYSVDTGWDHLNAKEDTSSKFDGSYLIMDEQSNPFVIRGTLNSRTIEKFGLHQTIKTEDGKKWILYYVNDVIYFVGLFRYAFRDSLVLFLAGTIIILVVVSIILSYFLSKLLTSPIRRMIPVLNEIGERDFRSEIPVTTTDEYGRIGVALNRMTSELQQALQARKNLTADVAHELRTPLTVVSGKLEYLQQRNHLIDPAELLPLQDELIRLNHLVNDLQELSRAEAGQLTLQLDSVDIYLLLERIVDKVSLEADEREIKIYLTGTPGMKAIVDRNRLTQVLLNLIMNSIRYSMPGGEVRIEPKIMDKKLLIAVIDTGAGIDPEHLPYLFHRFYRADQARDRDSGGTGLGLAIASEYVRAHDGEIAVESEKGRGTTFCVQIPLQSDD